MDLWTVDKHYLDADRFEIQSKYQKTFKPTVADLYILKDKSVFRVLNIYASTFNDNTPTSYFFHSIGGYHGAKLQRYQELIDSSLINDLNHIRTVGSRAKTLTEFQSAFDSTFALNMLNAKYVIYNPDAPQLKMPGPWGMSGLLKSPFWSIMPMKNLLQLIILTLQRWPSSIILSVIR